MVQLAHKKQLFIVLNTYTRVAKGNAMELHALATSAWRSFLACGDCIFSNGSAPTISQFTSGMSAVAELVKRLDVFWAGNES